MRLRCVLLDFHRMRSRGVAHMRRGRMMLKWSRSMVLGLLLVDNRLAATGEGVVCVGERDVRAMDHQIAVGDMVLRTGGKAGRRIELGQMQEPIVRQRVVPVTVVPQPVCTALRHVDTAVDVDDVGDVVVGRVEVATVVVVGVADRHCPYSRAGGVEARTDEAAVVVIPVGNIAPGMAAPTRHAGVADLGEIRDRLRHRGELVVARLDLVVHRGQQVGDLRLCRVDLLVGVALLLHGIEAGVLLGLAAGQVVILCQQRNLVVRQVVDDGGHLGKGSAVEGAEGFHVGDEMPDEPSTLLVGILRRLVYGKGDPPHKDCQQEGCGGLGRKIRDSACHVHGVSPCQIEGYASDSWGEVSSLHLFIAEATAERGHDFLGFSRNPCPRPIRPSALNNNGQQDIGNHYPGAAYLRRQKIRRLIDAGISQPYANGGWWGPPTVTQTVSGGSIVASEP